MKHLPNLLIVDDSDDNLFLLTTVITQKIKVNLIKALSGTEALEKTEGIKLALALIDVQMPGMNGYDLAIKLNESRSNDKVPIIFITANEINETDVFRGYETGAVDYINKPVHNHILLSKINVFLDLFNQKQTILADAALLKISADELMMVNSALKKSEEKYRSYIDNAPDGVFVADETGNYIEVNDAAIRLTGYSKDELLKMKLLELLTNESYEDGAAHFRRVLNTGTSKSDLLFKHKNGTKRWWTVEAVKLTETRILGFAKDITERKLTEEELKSSLDQLHQLTQYIETVRENERVSISRELHDDLGQALTAVKIDLGIIKQNVSDSDVILKINKVSALVGDTIKTVQRLTSQLRPEIIDDLGLDAAIEWYTNEFSNRNGVKVFLDMDPGLSISPNDSLALFRIMQESLTNIARHSMANHVEIGICKTGDSLSFRISDNGIGITEDKIKSKKSLGIISMKERAASLGAYFEIYRKTEGGTMINIILPLNKNL
jgi:PAS domain S-box-containing protein